MNLPGVFARYRAEIDTELRSVLAERRSPLYDMMRYHLGWIDERGKALPGSSGKALRPTLCLLACEAVGENYRRALPAAAAVELVHNFSLIHDDIQDDDRERRHHPTVWSLWGKPQAINAGTAMRVLANLALQRPSQDVPLPKRLRAQYILDEDCLSLIEGQYLDISYESRFDITVDDYLDMVEKKTSALIACSVEIGALLGTGDEAVIRSFRNIGRSLGLAFQIRDDVLGIWGDEAKTGKPAGSDIRRRKKSLPVIYALDKAQGELRKGLIDFYRNGRASSADEKEPALIARSSKEGRRKISERSYPFPPGNNGTGAVLRTLEAVGARADAQKLAERYRDEALAEIERLSLLPSARHDLEELLHFLVERSF